MAATRQAKIDQAIAEGRPPPERKKRATAPKTNSRYRGYADEDEMPMGGILGMMFGRYHPDYEPYDPECGGWPWGG